MYASIEFNAQISSNKSFSIPITLKYNINENLSIFNKVRFYNIEHPHLNYLYHNPDKNSGAVRENLTAINEINTKKLRSTSGLNPNHTKAPSCNK